MFALFHIQAPETDAHYLSGIGVWRFNEKMRVGSRKDDYSRNCETGSISESADFMLFFLQLLFTSCYVNDFLLLVLWYVISFVNLKGLYLLFIYELLIGYGNHI